MDDCWCGAPPRWWFPRRCDVQRRGHACARGAPWSPQAGDQVETDANARGCPGCGVLAIGHGRREVKAADAPCFGLRVLILVEADLALRRTGLCDADLVRDARADRAAGGCSPLGRSNGRPTRSPTMTRRWRRWPGTWKSTGTRCGTRSAVRRTRAPAIPIGVVGCAPSGSMSTSGGRVITAATAPSRPWSI